MGATMTRMGTPSRSRQVVTRHTRKVPSWADLYWFVSLSWLSMRIMMYLFFVKLVLLWQISLSLLTVLTCLVMVQREEEHNVRQGTPPKTTLRDSRQDDSPGMMMMMIDDRIEERKTRSPLSSLLSMRATERILKIYQSLVRIMDTLYR